MNNQYGIQKCSKNINTPYIREPSPRQTPAATYGSTLGVAVGMAAGITYRLWNQAPNALDSPVQTSVVYTFTLAHLVHVIPQVVKTWNNGKKIGFWQSINNEIHQLRPRAIARTIIPTAVAAILEHSRAQWMPTVAKVLTMDVDTGATRVVRVLIALSSQSLFHGLILKTILNAPHRIEGEDKDSETSHWLHNTCLLATLSSIASLYPTMSALAQLYVENPLQYMFAAVPVLTIGLNVGARTWHSREEFGLWNSFKREITQLQGSSEIVQATTMLAIAIFTAATQAHWMPLVAKAVPIAGDLSSHIVTQLTLAWSQSLGMQAAAKAGFYKEKVARTLNKHTLVHCIANGIFMLNTIAAFPMTTFQLGKDVVSGSLLALSAIGVGAYISKGLPCLLDITAVTNGATMIATGLGYASNTFSTTVLAPLSIACIIKLPKMMAHILSPGRLPAYRLEMLFEGISTFSVPALTIMKAYSNDITALAFSPSIRAITTLAVMSHFATASSELFQLAQGTYKLTTNNRRIAYGFHLAGTITAVAALATPSATLGGALWIAHAGCRVLNDHYQIRATAEYQRACLS